MRIHVSVQNNKLAQLFTKNNPAISAPVFHLNSTSAFSLLKSIIYGEDDYALFVKDDVFLPLEIVSYVNILIETLNRDWPNWGICGNTGIIAPRTADGLRACRYLFDLNGGPSLMGHILPAETIGESVILVNCKALRSRNFTLPSFEGSEYHGLVLSIETLAAGLAVLVGPQLACYQHSKSVFSELDNAECPLSLINYLASRLSNRSVNTINGIIRIPFKGSRNGRFDICITAVKNASVCRKDASIAFIIRSQFRNIQMLERAIQSTLAFASATSNRSISTYVVTDKVNEHSLGDLASKITVISVPDIKNNDSRNVLIREAVRLITEDHIFFLDDDDWVFPNEADYISHLLSCLPEVATLVVDSQTFSESISVVGGNDWRNSTLERQRRFGSADWFLNFSGHNHIPVCGAFYSRSVLREQPANTFDTITYYEDFALSIFALLNCGSVFFSVPKIVAGISIREVGNGIDNTVNISDRTKWSQSQAELAHYLCVNTGNNMALSLGGTLANRFLERRFGHSFGENAPGLSWLDRKALALSRTFHGFAMFSTRPKYYRENLKRYYLALRQRGFRGAIRALADTRE